MNNRRSMSLAWLVAGTVMASLAQGAAGAEEMPSAAIPCMGCHGIPDYFNVYPTYHVPRLGGQHADYIAAAIKAYKAGQRSHPTMRAQAAGLSDKDIADIARFFSAQQGE